MKSTEEINIRTKLSILAIGLLSFLGILIETSMNVTFPTLMQQMNVSLNTVQWLTTGYLLLVTIVMATTAYLLKRINVKKVFLFAVAINIAGSFLCAMAPDFLILLIGRLFQSASIGLATPTLFYIIFRTIPMQKLGQYNGFAAMLISLAPALGPTYGGILNNYFSWRIIFWIIIPILFIVLWIGSRNISLETKKEDLSFDFIGLFLLALILIGLEFTLTQFSKYGLNYRFQFSLFSTLVILFVYLVYDHFSSRHLFDFSILKPIVNLRLFNYFSLQAINIGLSFLIPIFAENFLKTNSLLAGLILLPGSLLGAATAPIAGSWYDKVGAKFPLILSNSLIVFGAFLLWIFTDHLTIWLIMFFYLILRLGFNLGFGNTMSDASKYVDNKKRADQSSLFNMAQQYAGSIGTAVMSAMIAFQSIIFSNISSSKATLIGGRLDFAILFILAILSLSLTIFCQHLIKKNNQSISNQ